MSSWASDRSGEITPCNLRDAAVGGLTASNDEMTPPTPFS